MRTLKNSLYYSEALQELIFDFGSYYLFDGFVVAEINEDVVFSWENHGKTISEAIADLYGNSGENLIYISNRAYNYSLKPTGWLSFFKYKYQLMGYAIVAYSKAGFFNGVLEKIFFNLPFKRFTDLNQAIEWAKWVSSNNAKAS